MIPSTPKPKIPSIPKSTLQAMPTPVLDGLMQGLAQAVGAVQSKINQIKSKISKLVESAVEEAKSQVSDTVSAGATATTDAMSHLGSEGLPSVTGAVPPNPGQLGQVKGALKDLKIDANTTPEQIYIELGVTAALMILRALLADKENEMKGASEMMGNINAIKAARASGKEPEPQLNIDELDPKLSALAQQAYDRYMKLVDSSMESPKKGTAEKILELKSPNKLLKKSEFDVLYGPPVSIKGQFILSEDGLYYDSRTGGLPDVSGFIEASKSWKLNFAPNLGGKGVVLNSEGVEGLIDSIFTVGSLDTDDSLEKYFESDALIQSFERDKANQIYNVSSQVTELLTTHEYDSSSAIVQNYYRNMGAIAALFDARIVKRKKQVQLGVVFGGYSLTEDTYEKGAGILINKVGDEVDMVPVNDFTFLKGSGVSPTLQQQIDVVLMSEDVEDTTLPIIPKFLTSKAEAIGVIDTFRVEKPTIGSFSYYQASAGSDAVDSLAPQVNNLTDFMVQDGLIINYSFINPNVEGSPSANVFNLDNAADSNKTLNGQLVAQSIEHVFSGGLGIAYLQGTDLSAGQSYVRLPNNSRDGEPYPGSVPLDNLLYSKEGCTIDFWAHLPSLPGKTDFEFLDTHAYRLVMANENSGGSNRPDSDTAVFADRTVQEYTEGMIIGFRDKGGATGASGGEFVVLPTVAQNHQDGLWGHSVCIAESHQVPWPTTAQTTELGFKVPVTTEFHSASAHDETPNTKTIASVNTEFVHFSLILDPPKDAISLYCDGMLVGSNSIRTSFGMASSMDLLNIPTCARKDNRFGRFDINSFDWAKNTGPRIGTTGSSPLLHELAFTPWVLGGGFTDGMPGGFLGKNTNTTYNQPPNDSTRKAQHQDWPVNWETPEPARSGLEGFLGSFKVYNRPLSKEEVARNYKLQRGFFKHIKLD